jgi:hypothetical protein
MMSAEDDYSYVRSRAPGKVIISKSFPTVQGKARFASEVVDGAEGLQFVSERSEVVLRQTPANRYQIKAKFLEDDRRVLSLVIQRFGYGRVPSEAQAVSLYGAEVDRLMQFILGVKTIPLEDSGKRHVPPEQLRDIILNEAQARTLLEGHEELFASLMESEHLQRDLVAVGYRRKELGYFEKLLTDGKFFLVEQQRLSCSPESVWQQFFERNSWIFGYGLSYQFLTALDDRKLEQVVGGADVTNRGKRTDALMKTRARINSLCFVEIKRHDTPLLAAQAYRSAAWPPSKELSGAISQMQVTVQTALERIGRKLVPEDDEGNPTGESLFNVQPRSFVVAGCLDEFHTPNGINEAKVRSFELYRQNIGRPEILTFDELLARAKFIVEHESGGTEPAAMPDDDIDVPF